MPSFRPDSGDAPGLQLDELEQLTERYTEALAALGQGEVESARDKIQAAGDVLLALAAIDRPDPLPGAPNPDEALTPRLRAKAQAALDLHTRLLDDLRRERDNVAREQKSLCQGKRHLESLHRTSRSGSILDSEA